MSDTKALEKRTPGWKSWSDGVERWWQGSQWSETYRAAEVDDITKADREQEERDSVFGPEEPEDGLSGPERVRAAIRADRGGEAPVPPQGFA